ncbi:MAG: Proline dipeptidase [uncultured Sphingomonadaceae bacterium]|uniref:Proline dipeptidase n=1 Tax=uncultured Sphingomonadaceae bacterium TaxID=169976 RepID=A0A6J4TKL5_9SPHN|nr:MAG: Proline dipeptidase [uncultured Sphingomonadaceae bacterium]
MPDDLSRRDALGLAAGAALLAGAPLRARTGGAAMTPIALPPPIVPAERAARIAKAQGLMRAAKLGALLIEPGASLTYFTGLRWGRSERLTAAIIPAAGEPFVVTPFFEEPSVRESLGVSATIHSWQEDEDPLALVAKILRARGLADAPVGVEETVRFFAVDGLARHGLRTRPGAPVVRACRMIKSASEIALMQAAADVTMAAYRHVHPRIRAGMTPADIGAMMNAATAQAGGKPEFALVLLGEASAYPHGTGKPQQVRANEVVLMDCGCTVHGYQSDISRSFVHGAPTAQQRRVWNHMRRGQDVAFAAARIGAPAGRVDDAVRAYYESQGYGSDYKLPGLSHRTGHGIGMDGHEPVNLVRGEMTPLAAGMCFSNEPGLYLPGAFGIRLEDCFHMTDAGPRYFSQPSPSIDRPFGQTSDLACTVDTKNRR